MFICCVLEEQMQDDIVVTSTAPGEFVMFLKQIGTKVIVKVSQVINQHVHKFQIGLKNKRIMIQNVFML